MPHRRLLAVASALLALSLAPAAAQAALSVSAVSATPSTTQAGGHPDLALSITLGGAADNIRNLTLHLPKGLVGNPQAVGTCTQAQFAADGCSADSQVGTIAINATVTQTVGLVPVTVTQDVSGRIFNLAPNAGEPARLGILLPSASALGGLVTTSPIRLQAAVAVRTASDFGLDSVQTDLPRTVQTSAGTAQSQINRITLTLTGSPAGAKGPFVTNPTTCGAATTSVDVTSYGGAASTGSAAFTPTGCDSVPYHPALTASIVGGGVNEHPQLTTVVSQDVNEATSRTVVVTLPEGIGPNTAALAVQCPSADFDAGTCAANTQVGTGTATTPLLPGSLTGPVFLVAPPAGGGALPGLGISLGGLLPVKLRGVVSLNGTRLVTTIDGIPDTPISTFALTLDGGDRGLLVAGRDFCTTPGTVDGAFTSTSGIASTTQAKAVATKCAVKAAAPAAAPATPVKKAPSVKPSLAARLSRTGSLTVVAKVRSGASKIKSIKLALPKGLRADATKRLRATRKGSAKVTLVVSHAHLKITRSRLSRTARVTVSVTNAAKKTYRLTVRLAR